MKIGIIGIRGVYGQWFKAFFEGQGHVVIGSGRTTPMTNKDVVEQSDIVIFSMKPMRAVPKEMLALAQYAKKTKTEEGQLWIDITGLKEEVSKAAAVIGNKISFFSFHPMFAVGSPVGVPQEKLNWKGRNVIVTQYPDSKKWRAWTDAFLLATQVTVSELSPKEHDEQMALIQALPHAMALVLASVLKEQKTNPEKLFKLSTPVYKTAFMLMSRVLSKNPELYAEIQMDNSRVLGMLDSMINEMQKFRSTIAEKNSEKFVAEFLKNKEYIGDKLLAKVDQLFEQMHF